MVWELLVQQNSVCWTWPAQVNIKVCVVYGPEGFICVVLFYLIYVKDTDSSCEGNNLQSFADNASLYMWNPNLSNLYSDANPQINNLFLWLILYQQTIIECQWNQI